MTRPYALLLVAVLVVINSFVCSQTLPDYLKEVSSNTIPALINGDAAFVDYDKDGDLDLLICGQGTDQLPAFSVLGNSGGTFSEQKLAASPTGTSFCSMGVGDWNKDGFPDLMTIGAVGTNCIVAGGLAPETNFYLHTDQGFEPFRGLKFNNVYDGAVRVVDFDNDGYPDVLSAGANLNPCDPASASPQYLFTDLQHNNPASQTLTLQNDAFALPQAFQGLTASSFDTGDLDGDGLIDLVGCGAAAPNPGSPDVQRPIAFIAYQAKAGSSPVWEILPGTGIAQVQNCALKLIDYDIDGDLDIYITGDDGKVPQCQMLTNTGTAAAPRTWKDETQTKGNLTCLTGRPRLAVADFDKDGLPDIVAQGTEGGFGFSIPSQVTVLYMSRPVSRQSFLWERHLMTNISFGSIAVGDFNGDQYPDLFVNGHQSAEAAPESHLYLSTIAAAVTSLTSSAAAESTFASTSLTSLAAAGLLTSTTGASTAQRETTTAALSTTLAALQSSTSTSSTSTSATVTGSTLQGTTTGAASMASYATTVSTALQSSVAAATSTLSTGGEYRQPTLTIVGLPFSGLTFDLPDEVQMSGEDTELHLGLTFRVRISKIQEEDENGYADPLDNPCPIPAQFNSSTANVRTPTGTAFQLTRSATLCNGARITLVYTKFAGEEHLSFAGEQFTVPLGQIKLQGSVSNWPFSSRSHRLLVQTQITIVQNASIVGEQFYDSPPQRFYWVIQARPKVWLETALIRKGILDGVVTPLNLSPSLDGPQRLDIRMPHFSRDATWDPTFDALLAGEYPAKKNKKGLKIGIPVAIGGCFIIVLVVVGVFMIRKHMSSKTPQTDVPSKRYSERRPTVKADEEGVL